ncbi:CKLF MARVEL transmembrane domain-containing protein 4 [Danaus plexippus plexippus]|uniref:CKLF MARVEL transmembrane domain-containing protein 4 n=1 Tax=Danaus plexippus plexippus TaxID=278856 RepID=A0A212F7X2_DANPL|nr:CKLF MARVEL transmembrane domain-containing protein 4 [Danaus plexippus plexippus]
MTSSQTQSPPEMGSTNVVFRTQIRFDHSYLKTIPGIVKAAVIVLNLLGFICIQSSAFWSNSRGVYFNVVSQMGLWFTGILLLLYLFHVVEKFHNFMWLKVEMIGCAVLTFLYLIASTIVVAFGSAAYSAAGFFGYLAMVLYGFDSFQKFRDIRAGALAQGECVQTKQQHITTPPALP